MTCLYDLCGQGWQFFKNDEIECELLYTAARQSRTGRKEQTITMCILSVNKCNMN